MEDRHVHNARCPWWCGDEEATKEALTPKNYSGGMTLGELIAALEESSEYGADAVMAIGLGEPLSNRGFFDTLAFIAERDVSVAESLRRAKSAVGQTYEGWKGGDYTMTLDTEVYLTVEAARSGAAITKDCLKMLLTLVDYGGAP